MHNTVNVSQLRKAVSVTHVRDWKRIHFMHILYREATDRGA
jgi:hypothetical protein